MTKVLVVGLDGATFDVIRPLADEGRLPNLAYLMHEGAWGPLQSTIPPVTPAAWTTFFTGKNPGKHGIFDFQRLDPATYQLHSVRLERHREKTIWQLLGEAQQRSLVIDVPFTYPPTPLNGWMLTGFGTPRTPGTVLTYPEHLEAHLPADLRSEVRLALPDSNFDRSRAFIDQWQEVMAGRRRLLPYLVAEQDWDFFITVFSITDLMAHVFWTYIDPAHPNYERSEGPEYREAFWRSYEMCDRLLGELMAAAGPTTTLVLSDHGFGSMRPRQYLFRQLLTGGYVHMKRSRLLSFAGKDLMKLIMESYVRFPFLREWIKGLRPGRREAIRKSLKRARLIPRPDNIDYGHSLVVPTDFGMRMWVNDRDRFGQGIVPPEDKEKLMDQIRMYLMAEQDPLHQRPIVKEVHFGHQRYHGPFTHRGPDLAVEYINFYRPHTPHPGVNPHLEGGHTREGVFLAHGAPIQPIRVAGATLMDLAPTILHLLGHPVPPDMDGRVLTEIFSDAYREAHPVQQGTKPAHHEETVVGEGYTEAEEAEVIEQLRQLGYI